MGALKQYIDFYRANSAAIDANSAPAINALRQKALDALDGKELPHKGEENYEVTDVDALFAPDYGINVNRRPLDVDIAEAFRCDVPNMSTWLYVAVGDIYRSSRTAGLNMPASVIVGSLREAAIAHPEIVAKYYGKYASLDDAYVALNSLLAQDGLLVYVPSGVVLERPVQLVNIMNAAAKIMAFRRILVVVEDGAQARLLVCDHTQKVDEDCLASQVVEIYVGADATFDYYDIEETGVHTHRVSSLFVHQEAGSNVLVDGITLMNGTSRNDYRIDFCGEHAETRLLGMAISNGDQHIDNHTFIAHNATACTSNELFKYVLDDNAQGAFSGKILVAPDCPKTEAYQSNRNICASPTAKMHTKPQLEIYTDDVKCGHGATVGQLDQEALFYMRTRGIPYDDARTMLMQAFMSDVIDAVRLDNLRDRLHHLVEKRFDGSLALCRDCGNACHNNSLNNKNNNK
jgi:Fe-S cluster assembly protein SufD